MDGHHIRVDHAAPPRDPEGGARGAGAVYDPARTVFVGNLDFKVGDASVHILGGGVLSWFGLTACCFACCCGLKLCSAAPSPPAAHPSTPTVRCRWLLQVADEDLIRIFSGAAPVTAAAGAKPGAHRPPAVPELAGAVEAVRVVRDKKTNIGKGFAFVLLRSAEVARAALRLNGVRLNKRSMRVTRASRSALRGGGGGSGVQAGGSQRGGGGGAGFGRGAGAATGSSGAGPIKHTDWQGTRTKGRPSAVAKGARLGAKGAAAAGRPRTRGPAAALGAASGGVRKKQLSGAAAKKAEAKRTGKRPSVVARKAKTKAAAAAQRKAGGAGGGR